MDEAERFRSRVEVEVRNYEIDWQGIVHNANYLLYFEVGRIAYLRALGIVIDGTSVKNEANIVVARNEIDYRSPAKFGDTLEVLTRISRIGETSFAFKGVLRQQRSGVLVAENRSIHVWLDPAAREPVRVPEEFRGKVRAFEGENVLMDQPRYFACI